MALSNFERMLQLADEAFDSKNDPGQLQVNEKVLERLQRLHPATLSEYDDGNGPAVWILVIPTTKALMKKFISGVISEQELLELTPLDAKYEAIYLCSAMTLPEHRNKGIAKRLTLEAINKIRDDHPIETLFVWPFSEEGNKLATSVAEICNLPLVKR